MTVVVTGASGHVGANLVRILLNRGERVRALVHNDQRALEGLEVEVVRGDICDPDRIRCAFRGADVVYHAAGQVSILLSEWEALEAVNVGGARNVVDACLHCGVRRLVHFSSIEAFSDESPDALIDEASPRAKGSNAQPYARSKVEGEQVVREGIARGLDAVIVNPTAIIGPHDYRGGPMSDALLRLARGSLPFLVEGGFNWVDVRDVAAGAIRAAEAAPPAAQYILAGHWVSLRELAARLEEATGTPAPRWTAPMGLARLGAPFITAYSHFTGRRALYTSASLRPLRSYRHVSPARATRDLGYRPRPFPETIADTVRWLEEGGYLPQARGQPRPAVFYSS
jgi:nucleoside-diphosphate-sugar epimerase